MNHKSHANAANGEYDIEHTRRELLNFLARERAAERAAEQTTASRGRGRGKPASSTPGFDWSSLLGVGVSSWWHEHPARAVALLLQSAISEYARRKPIQVVAVAAVAGAALVLVRPWRMISATALLLSLLRSSNFTGMATSVIENAARSLKPTQKERL